MKKVFFCISLFFVGLRLNAQTDNVGSGRAVHFNGINNYIDLGNRYNDVKLPVTISAWIHLSSSVSNWAPVFVSQDNAPVYNGFWLIVQPNLIGVGYGDGTGENLPQFRRSKTASVNNISERWVHVTGIIRGKLDMDIYLNGVNVGGSYSGSSDLPMSSSNSDVVKIGRWFSNNQTFHFGGLIDEVRLWNRSLSENEIRILMCKKLNGSEAGLIGNWTFNEVTGSATLDQSSNHFDGTLQGVTRQFSGAPLGDESKFTYSTNWANKDLSIKAFNDSVTVTKIAGHPHGVHIYAVNEMPSQRDGLEGCSAHHYFGVFVDHDITSSEFDFHYTSSQTDIQRNKVSSRNDNSVNPWNMESVNSSGSTLILTNLINRGEFIRAAEGLKINLGPDLFSCDLKQFNLDASKDDPSVTYEWSTGMRTPVITVNHSGEYWVKIKNQCGEAKDTIEINFYSYPPALSLGSETKNLCTGSEIILKPHGDLTGMELTWSDGSHNSTLTVNKPGIYSVIAENICGFKETSITINQTEIDSVFVPNVITPNHDPWNQFLEIHPGPEITKSLFIYNRWGEMVYHSKDYQNDWDGANLPSGVYYYHLVGECLGTKKGSLNIIR